MKPEEARASVLRKVEESTAVKRAFFEAHADLVSSCAERLAKVFDAGGRLFVFGNGGSACDAQHVAVEFMHPIFEKRPQLPAIALATDAALLSAIGNDQDFALVFAHQLRALARRGDAALGISTSGQSANVNRGLVAAREMGLVTVGMSGKDGGKMRGLVDYSFHVESYAIHRVQETHVTLLHVLWDLVHCHRGEEDVLG